MGVQSDDLRKSIHVIHLGSQLGRFAFPNREND